MGIQFLNLELGIFDEEVLDLSFNWLNDKEVKFLTRTPELSRETQKNWFKTLSHRNDYLVKTLKADNVAIGVVGLKKIDHNKSEAEYFGYIGNKAYWGKGVGQWMLAEAINVAKNMQLAKLYLNVITENYIAVNLYFKMGFKITRYTSDSYLMEKNLK
ncbi:MAG: GNAT family N-acetyltransferase [Ilyomonas sp.]